MLWWSRSSLESEDGLVWLPSGISPISSLWQSCWPGWMVKRCNGLQLSQSLCIFVIGHTCFNKKKMQAHQLCCCCHSIQPQPLYNKLLSLSPVNLASEGEKTQKHYCPWVISASLLTVEQNVCISMNKTGCSLCSYSQSESPQKLFSVEDWLVVALLQTLGTALSFTLSLWKKIIVANVKLLTDVDSDIPILKHPWYLTDAQEGQSEQTVWDQTLFKPTKLYVLAWWRLCGV